MTRAGMLVLVAAASCGTLPNDDADPSDATLPKNPFCDPVSDWDPAWEAWEEAIREDVRAVRADGADCGELGPRPAARDVELSGALTCAARAHARDMAMRDFFAHDDPDGLGPDDRVAAAGGMFLGLHEDIQAGALDPAQVTPVWLADDLQCVDLLFEDFDRIGVGYFGGDGGSYAGYVVLLLAADLPDR